MSLQNSHQISEIKVLLKKGADGSGIENIELTGQTLNVDTYTITLTNGDKYTFDVTNGTSIASIEKTSTVGNVDTYTITLTDGSTSAFTVTNAYGATASDITYNNTASGLTGTNVQDALDEVTDDNNIKYDNTSSGMTATNVQDALDEVNTKTKHGLYEMWVNPSPTSAFAGQTVVVNKNGYSIDALFLEMGEISNSDFRGKAIVPIEVGKRGVCQFGAIDGVSRFYSHTRGIETSVSGDNISVVFGDCSRMLQTTVGSGAPSVTTDNANCIPMRILGLIHNS